MFVLAHTLLCAQNKNTNIVIQQLTDVYKLIPAKDGKSLQRVDEKYEVTFRALRTGGVATGVAFYNDDIKITKASGGDTSYGPFLTSDIFFSDSKACMVRVELKKAGSTGKATFNSSFTKPEFFCKVLLAESYDIENAVVSFEIPQSLAGRFSIEEVNMPEGKMTRTSATKDGSEIITYTFTDIKTPKVFDDSPSRNITAPQFIIRGHFDNVDGLYRYLAGYVDQVDPAEAAVAEKARQITEGCSNDAERIAAVTDFVHDKIRYVAVEHGEFGHRPDIASEVLRKAYGDCKGSASLIKGMLRSLGIDARLAWVGTSSIRERWTDCPNVSSGNHMIAAVVNSDTIMFIDGTARYCRAGQLPVGIQGSQAIVEDGPDKCIVAMIPELPSESNMRRENITLEIMPDGKLALSGDIVFTGSRANTIRSNIDDTPPNKRKELIDRIFATVAEGSLPEEATVTVTNDSVVISGRTVAKSAVKNVGGEIYVDANPFYSLPGMRFKTEDRTTPGLLGSRMAYDCKFTLILPEGTEAVDLPDDVTVESRWIRAAITTRYGSDNRSVVRQFTMSILDPEVDLDDMKQFNAYINRLNRACTSQLVLKKL